MDLINWSFNEIFSTGSGEPQGPDGTVAAGYVRDYYENWRSVCLSILSVVEGVEDVIILGTMVAGLISIGLGIALVYRKIGTTAALHGTPRLPDLVSELSKAVGQQGLVVADTNRKIDILLNKINALHEEVTKK